MPEPKQKGQDEFKTAVTATVVWVAGVTLFIIFASLLVGIWLDRTLHTKPFVTIILLIGSIPITIFLTIRIVRKATAGLHPSQKRTIEEETHRAESRND
jgi:F0F1-type ATP synthase assembly protein I